MSRQPDRVAVPAVQRLRIHYAKRGRLRFSSHRDFQRAFERALRRAGVPIAYSAGFSPHPKVSYAGAAPTGVASEAEYLDICVTRRCDPGRVAAALDEALPEGLDVVTVVEAAAADLAERLEASSWEIVMPGVDPARAEQASAAFLSREEVLVERLTKSGVRTFDARGPVLRVAVRDAAGSGAGDPAAGAPCAILTVVVRHVTPAVRPDDVLAALRRVADLAPPVPVLVTRLAQGPLVAEPPGVGDPLDPDRGASGVRDAVGTQSRGTPPR